MKNINRNRFESLSCSIIQFYLDTIDFPSKSARQHVHNVSFDEANLAQPTVHPVPAAAKNIYVNLPDGVEGNNGNNNNNKSNGNFSFIEPMDDKTEFEDTSLNKDLDRTVYTTTYEDNNLGIFFAFDY